MDAIERAKRHFGKLLAEQIARVEQMKTTKDWVDYSKLKPIRIGVAGGDGIGPTISEQTKHVLELLLKDELENGKAKLQVIEGLTIENRAKVKKAIPDDVLAELKKCHVILKGPTTTPKKGDPWPNVESANVAMRKELDLFANIRPVQVLAHGIDWTFFRENTEGAYAVGSRGIDVTNDLAVDFTVTTTQGSERIIRLAFDYAKKNSINKITIVTKANIIKTTDGKFLSVAERVAKEYPEVEWNSIFIDAVSAKLADEKQRTQFRILVLPNLYGDIITEEAAVFQGGIGTAGSANIGKRYAMFEAIHGSAPDLVESGLTRYADPSGILRAAVMLLRHIGFDDKARKLEMALDVCGLYEKKLIITGRPNGATGEEFTNYIIKTTQNPKLGDKWQGYQRKNA